MRGFSTNTFTLVSIGAPATMPNNNSKTITPAPSLWSILLVNAPQLIARDMSN